MLEKNSACYSEIVKHNFKRVKLLSLLLTRLLFSFRVAAMCFGENKVVYNTILNVNDR
jgi:hypothetical protein